MRWMSGGGSSLPPDFSAAPVRARDRDRSLSASPSRPPRRHRPRRGPGAPRGGRGGGADGAHPREQRRANGNDDSANTSGNDHAQLFHTGAHAAGYTLTSVVVNSDDAEDDDFDVEICDGGWHRGRVSNHRLHGLDGAGELRRGRERARIEHAGLALSANTNYVVVIKQRGTGSVELDSTTSSGEDSDRPLGLEHQKQVLLEERQYLDD